MASSLLLLAVLAGRDEDASRAVPPASAVVADARPLLTGPPRGPLAADTGFVDAVRLLPWGADPMPDPPLETRWVTFAGDVPGARWALVVTIGPQRAAAHRLGPAPVVTAWFGGPPGVRADQMSLQAPPAARPADAPAALLDQRTGTLLVVAAPGDVVEVSERPEIAEDGSVSRAWRRIEVSDGIALARLRPSDVPVNGAVIYRVQRGGRTVARGAPETIGDRPGAPLPVAVTSPRGPPSPAAARAVHRTAEQLLAHLGPAPHEVAVTAVWTGGVPGPGPASGEAVVVAVTLPSGAVVVDGEWLLPVTSPSGDYVQRGDCGLDVLPAGPPVEQRVLPLACDVVDGHGGAPVRTFLVVVTPPPVRLVRVYDSQDHWLAEQPVVGGVVVTPLPLGAATVEAVTAGGIGLGRVALLARGVDFGT